MEAAHCTCTDCTMLDYHVPFPTMPVPPMVVVPLAFDSLAADSVGVLIAPVGRIIPQANYESSELAHQISANGKAGIMGNQGSKGKAV